MKQVWPLSLLIDALRRRRRLKASRDPAALEHAQRMLEFYGAFVKLGDLCFDVGANIGDRTDVFLRLGATVVAIEPQESCQKLLRSRFAHQAGFVLVPEALGAAPGRAEMFVGEVDKLATLSPDWIKAVTESGRFHDHKWSRRVTVTVSTLDDLIRRFGAPRFCKIDVEGFEYRVLSGLSQPLPWISFEFCPEYIDETVACIKHLSQLGMRDFNYSLRESMRFALQKWVGPESICQELRRLENSTVFGDIYSRHQ